MLVEIALRELAHLLCGHVHGKNMQPLIVVEPGHSFAGIGFIEIPGDHHRIASGFHRFRAGSRGDESDLLAVGRPGHVVARARQRAVSAAPEARKVTSEPSGRATNSPPFSPWCP